MKFNYTDDQNKVIHTRGSSVLVSASAGSGKTAVLVARILSFLTDEKGLQEDCERISDYFHQLREYIFTLSAKSQSTIFRAID